MRHYNRAINAVGEEGREKVLDRGGTNQKIKKKKIGEALCLNSVVVQKLKRPY